MAGNTVIVSASFREGMTVQEQDCYNKGYVRGFDARTSEAIVDFPHHPRAAGRIRL